MVSMSMPIPNVRRCPVTRHILEVQESLFWTKIQDDASEHYRVVRLPRVRGVHGLQIPIFGLIGLEGAMSLGRERIDASSRARLALSLVVTAAFHTTW